ncbi:MAG: hypothetical protein ABSE93_09405 [Terriglobia bacterium]|jgi:hypothetical protein
MAWISYYNAGLSKQVVRQLLAVVKRNIQAALDFISGVPGSYAPFAEYDLALLPVQQFPAILLAPDTVTFDEEANCTLHQTMRLTCVIAVTHQDRNTLAEMSQDYVRAVRAVLDTLWESTPGDFLLTNLPLPSPPFASGALSPGLASGKLMKIFAEGHTFEEIRRRPQSGFAMAATMSIMVELEEV